MELNPIQTAVAKVAGTYHLMEAQEEKISELTEAWEHTSSQNALLSRTIDDLDWLNLFDLHSVREVIPIKDRKIYYDRLRRMRQENPLAKQSVKLITRFTLGKGVQISIGPDPDAPPPTAADVDIEADPQGEKLNGLFPGSKKLGTDPKPLPRARPQVSEAAELPDSDQLTEIIKDFWSDNENQLALTSHEAQKEWLDNVIVDGERFFIGFVDPSPPYIKLTEIPVEEIDEIIYHPDNRKMPVYYRRVMQKLKFEDPNGYQPDGPPETKYYLDYRITEEQLKTAKKRIKIARGRLADEEQRIFHTMINPLNTRKGKRGISELYASREWFRVYKEFMEDRAAINAAATAVGHKRKIKAGPTGVAQFTGKFGGIDVGYDNPALNSNEIGKLTRPIAGGMYDSNPAIDLEWMKTDTGAVNAREDGRSILMAATAGVGMFIHYMGEGGDANLATAQAMELPMVKTFEDWQQWVDSCFKALLQWVITIATDEENAKKQIERVAGSFPPLISQDVVKYTTAWSQVAQNIAPGNRVVHREAIRGALSTLNVPNLDALMTQIDAEEIRVEQERQKREAEMKEAMAQNAAALNGNGGPNPIKDGNGNGMDPMLKTVAKGKPEPARNGPKPPRP